MKKPRKLTELQISYVQHRAQGVGRRNSAIGAGYSPTSADQQSYALEHREDIKAAIAAAKRALKKGGAPISVNVEVESEAKDQMPKPKYSDSMEWLTDAMNHTGLPIALRGDYAKALMPYQHARVGEAGKKEKVKDRAMSLTNGAKGKFQPKSAPPKLKLVSN